MGRLLTSAIIVIALGFITGRVIQMKVQKQ